MKTNEFKLDVTFQPHPAHEPTHFLTPSPKKNEKQKIKFSMSPPNLPHTL